MNRINSRQLFRLVIIFFLGFALIAGVVLVRQRIINPKAGPGTPSLSFSVSSALAPANDFDLVISINPHDTAFNAFKFIFTFDNSKVELRTAGDLINNIEWGNYTSVGLKQASLEGNKITITDAKQGTSFTGTASIDLVKVKMKVKSGVSGNAVFSWQTGMTIGDYEDANLDKTNGTFPITGTAGAKLYFNSEKKTPVRNDSLGVDLYLDTNGAQVNSVQVSFIYDVKLSPQNTAGDNIILDPNSGFNTTGGVIKTIDANTRTVLLALATSTTVTGNNIKLATVLFQTGTTTGDVTFHTDQANSRVYKGTQNILTDAPDYQITIQTGTAASPTPTNTPVPTPASYPTTPPRLPKTPPDPYPSPPYCPFVAAGTNCTVTDKIAGDANCDGRIDSKDYLILHSQYDTMPPAQPVNINANFSCREDDSSTYFVDLEDFEIWRRHIIFN